MLTSFFSKSKPINYLVVGLYMLLLYVIAHVRKGFSLEIIDILWFLFGAVLYILPMLLLNLTAQKNDIIDQGTYTCVLYSIFTGLLLDSLTHIPVLLANFLVMLGLSNLFFFKNTDQMKAKIFNAAMYVALASLAFFWSIAFLIPMFLAISYYEPRNYRNWVIPLFAVFMVYVLSNCFTLLFYDSFFSLFEYLDPISISSMDYLKKEELFSAGTIGLCLTFFLITFIFSFKRKPANIKPLLRLTLVYLIIAVIITIISPQPISIDMFFVAVPLSIIGTTYLEMPYNDVVKEINMWVLILIPLGALLF